MSAIITTSRLLNHNDVRGSRVYEALLEFEYDFRGKRYRLNTPLLRSMQLFSDKNIEHELLAKYKEHDLVNVRVMPSSPQNAFIEVQPFSLASATGVPMLAILYAATVFGYGWIVVNIFNYESDAGDRALPPFSNFAHTVGVNYMRLLSEGRVYV